MEKKCCAVPILALLVVLLLVGGSASAGTPSWIIVGDSWGILLGPFQEAKLAELGLDIPVKDLAVGGSTAHEWAGDAGGILTQAKETLAALPPQDLAFVYVSLGGNDVLEDYPSLGAAVFSRIAADLQTVVGELLSAKPKTLILLGSYDLLNFQKSSFCESFALSVVGTSQPEGMNGLIRLGGTLVDLAAALDPRVLSLNVIGALQGTPGSPDLSSWSPAEFITADCIHLTFDGYTIFNDAMFATLLGQ
ncbi:MAG: hypothetical protein ACE5JX_19160 [Acidobacteriota bacterium]